MRSRGTLLLWRMRTRQSGRKSKSRRVGRTKRKRRRRTNRIRRRQKKSSKRRNVPLLPRFFCNLVLFLLFWFLMWFFDLDHYFFHNCT